MSLSVFKDLVFNKSTFIKENKKKVKIIADEKGKVTSFHFKGKLVIF